MVNDQEKNFSIQGRNIEARKRTFFFSLLFRNNRWVEVEHGNIMTLKPKKNKKNI